MSFNRIPVALIYEIVKDFLRYPEFVPWCCDVEISNHISQESLEAIMTIGFSLLKVSYLSIITFIEQESIIVLILRLDKSSDR